MRYQEYYMNSDRVKINCFKLQDQAFFAQRLSLLLDSGVSIVESLRMMSNIDNSKHRKNVYKIIIKDIEEGLTLSRSISNINLRFNSFLIILIRNGEEIGNLSSSLSHAYIYLEKKIEMSKKIVSSLIYPCFIIFATVAMTLFLVMYIFPKIIPLLNSLSIKLPLITVIVQSTYYFMESKGILSTIIILTLIFLLKVVINKSYKVRYLVHKIILKIPIIKDYLKIYLMSTVCSIVDTFLSSGKGLVDVIIFSRDSSSNLLYKEVFTGIHIELLKGISLYDSMLKHSSLFPSMMIDMCLLGERSGNLSLMFRHCSRLFDQDVDNLLKRFTSLIEPVLMVFMGLIVGGVALSIILPVYEITNHLSK